MGCFVVVLLLLIASFLVCSRDMCDGSAQMGRTSIKSTEARKACAAACIREKNPDEAAPECKGVTPMSEYKKCIAPAAKRIANECWRKCE